MTTVIVWAAYSDSGERTDLARAVYMASDSRITWGGAGHRWDAGRKLFSPLNGPHLFGYCGDVVFPSIVLAQIVSAIDHKILFRPDATPEQKHVAIMDSIKASHQRRHDVPEQDFIILHVYRAREWPETEFFAWRIDYIAASNAWQCHVVALPATTGIVVALGSGAGAAKTHAGRWNASDVGGTSRAIFAGFCDAISSGDDRLTGGAPQISSLQAEGPPRLIGYVEEESRYLHGLRIESLGNPANIQWVDRLFQTMEPVRLKPMPGARRFHRPRRV